MISVLFVDDDPALCDLGKLYLEKNENFRVYTAESARSAIKKMRSASYDAIVSDYQMPECSGIDLLKRVRSEFGSIPFILFTGKGREEVVIEAINNGADFYLQKGAHANALYAELGHKIQQAVGKRRAEALVAAIQDLTLIIASTATRKEALSLCLEAVIDLSGLDSGAIYLVDGHTGDLDLVASRGLSERLLADSSHIPAFSRPTRVVFRKKPVYLDFSMLDPDPGSAQESEGLKCMAIIPILHERRTIGCFNVSSHTAESVLPETRKVLEMIVSQVGNSIVRIIAEEALRESEQRYRNVVEDQTEFICRFLPDGTHVFVNEAYCRCFGKSREEVIGHRFIPGIPAGEGMPIREHLRSLTPENPVGTISHRVILPDGTVQWQRWSDRAIFDGDGRVVEYQSVGRDITAQKQVEEALRESEQRYRNVVEDQTEFICRFLPDGTHVFVNEAYCRCFGKSREEVIGHRFIPGIPAGEGMPIREHLRSLTPENPVAAISHRVILPDGTVQWQRWSDRAIFDGDGKVVEYQSVGRDITAQKQVEEALRNSEMIQREIISHLPDPTLVIDRDGVVIAWNRALEILTGTRAEDLIGRGNHAHSVPFYGERRPILIDLVLHEDEEILGKYQQILREGQTYMAETIFARPQGKTAILWGKASPLLNNDGQVIGAIESIRDITERKREEERIGAIGHKLSLLSDITRHDILNQVQVLKAYLELAGASFDDPADLAEYLDAGKKTAITIESQIALTREFQNLGRNTPGWLRVSGAVEEARSKVASMGIPIAMTGDDYEIYADPLFEKVIFNLFDNSVKHGGAGLTKILVSSHPLNGDLVLVCEDDGEGIPEKEKKHIFEKGFGRHNGLGLFLSREILNIAGMSIRETGVPGKGARFEIEVPAGMYRKPGDE
ncbi:PAS domain S-box-containing protein [Methanolinea mesophila]|uniref:PAS domain S-box protein n=1 Tax=Methanolinea mesophila TaxID=547055 RepID=UPI001AE11100|nr:PAS domain S-box protein [Methanolinea mesophila]MBP1929959.1 PAS domain S-box-containing protein [Methanolinea mesophila]